VTRLKTSGAKKSTSPYACMASTVGYFAFTYRGACFRSKMGKHERRKGEKLAKILCNIVPLRTVAQKTQSLIRLLVHIVKKSSPSVKTRKVRYCDYKSPSDIPNPSHKNPVHSLSVFLW
jgi:hypothetical protein